MSMSGELVPLSNNRDVYNMMHGTELTSHTGTLTTEQANRINDNYDIELHLGTHGLIQEATDPAYILSLPTQREYDAAAAVVENMQPGDTLFLEGVGFRKQPPEPVPPLPDGMPPEFEMLSEPMRTYTKDMYRSAQNMQAEGRARLERARQNSEIPAWKYAERLAEMKGIRTVYADYDVVDEKGIQDLAQGKDIMTIATSPDPQDKIVAKNMHSQRELKARNMVKDEALKHLPPEGTPVPEGRKPKLVLLFGKGHAAGFQKAFANIGLDAKLTILESTDMSDRHKEQVAHATSRVLGALMSSPLLSSPSTLDKMHGLAGRQGSILDGLRAQRQKKTPMQGSGLAGISRASARRKTFRDGHNIQDS